VSDSEEDDGLPEPEIEEISNFNDLPKRIREQITDGALLLLNGAGVHDSAIAMPVLSEVLVHTDRLFRIVQADRAGLDVSRTGRLVGVSHAKRLKVLPAVTGSFALPLRLDNPDGELVGNDDDALGALVEILTAVRGASEGLARTLFDYPERTGDELLSLLLTLSSGDVGMDLEVVRDHEPTRRVQIDAQLARARSDWLEEPIESGTGELTLTGKLFRVDTKNWRIRLDVSRDDDALAAIEQVSFPAERLEEVRGALDKVVEIDVAVQEERRRYERSARSRSMSLGALRVIGSDP